MSAPRHSRLQTLSLVLSAMILAVGCPNGGGESTTTTTSSVATTTTSSTPIAAVADKPKFTWRLAISPNVAKYVQMNWPRTVIAAETGAAGGLRCGKTVVVELKVKPGKADKTVDANPKRATVEGGKDCIEWRIVEENGDTAPANIELIDLIDSQGEVSAGKSKNPQAFGDQCKNSGLSCTVAVPSKSTHTEIYYYKAKVVHDSTPKESDPEIEILCTGCGEQ